MSSFKKTINEIFKIDKSLFKKIFLYGLAFSLVLFLIIQLFGGVSTLLSSKITSATGVPDLASLDAASLEASSSQISGLLFLFIVVGLIFALLLVYNYSFFENKIWNTIFNKKTDFKNTSKFLGLNILLAIIFSLVLFVLFLISAKLFSSVPKLGATIFYFAVLFSLYLMFVGYWAFGKTHEIIKSVKTVYFIGIKRLDLTIVELVVAFIIVILINIILLLFTWIPESIYLVLTLIGLIAYLSWFRLYLTNALKSVKL